MKKFYLLVTAAGLMASGCSVYKNTQTPDDVYYSPGASVSSSSSNASSGDYYNMAPSDQYVQMKVLDPQRWSYFDDYYTDSFSPMGYSPYGMGTYGFGFGAPWLTFCYWSPFSYWNSYYAWNSIYNPYFGSVVLISPKTPAYNQYATIRPFSPASYNNNNYLSGSHAPTAFSPYSQPYHNTPAGSAARRFEGYPGTGSNGNFGNTYRPTSSQPIRSYTPSSSFGGGSTGGSSMGGGMRGGGFGRH
jgi:hypothetical protein